MPTLTLEVSEQVYTSLETVAQQQGRSLAESAVDALAMYPEAVQREYAETCAAIERGIEDMEAGRTYSLEEAWQHLEARRETRRKARAEAEAAANP